MQVCSHHSTPGGRHARLFPKVQGSPGAGCRCRWAQTWEVPRQTVPRGMPRGSPVAMLQTSAGAAALLQGKKQCADFGRPGPTIPEPEPSHLHPTHHPSLPFQPHGHHSVVAATTSFLVMISASTLHAPGPVSHMPARASCPEEKLHSILPVLPSCHDLRLTAQLSHSALEPLRDQIPAGFFSLPSSFPGLSPTLSGHGASHRQFSQPRSLCSINKGS